MLWLTLVVAQAAPEPAEPDPLAGLPATHIAEVVDTAGLKEARVREMLTGTVKDQSVLDRMARPWEAKPWHQYRELFLTDARITEGRVFMKANAELFERAEAESGVDKHVIAAILGVETSYGKTMGDDAVRTALFTLGFHHAKRGKYFRAELGRFLALCEAQGWDPAVPKGSYAGAMGMGQFMHKSYQTWAVDFDGDASIDLFTSKADAIGSVGNYLAEHGWERGGAILVTPEVEGSPAAPKGLKLDQSLATLTGVKAEAIEDDTPLRLFKFEGAKGDEYRLGLQNFYVITRYNRSPLYARAVTELAEALAEPAAEPVVEGG